MNKKISKHIVKPEYISNHLYEVNETLENNTFYSKIIRFILKKPEYISNLLYWVNETLEKTQTN